MSRARLSDPRGFSLIEVIVALTISAILMSAALITFTSGKYTVQEAARRGQMARDAQLVLDMMSRDVASLGAGVPQGFCLDGCSATTDTFSPALRRATPDGFAFIGDAAYPNAELVGAATLTRFLGDADSATVALTAEITGPCTPHSNPSNAFRCDTSATTPLAGTFTNTDNCTSAQPNARLCPWNMNKWQRPGGNTELTFVDAAGDFYQRRWDGSTANVDNYFGVTVQQVTGGSSILPRTNFYDPIGSGYVAQLDRVFWSVEDSSGGACDAGEECTVKRRQCWGRMQNPSSATFPSTGTGAFTSTTVPENCSAPDEGTEWETITNGVTNFNIEYFGVNGVSLGNTVAVANLRNVRSLIITMTMEERVGQGPLLTQTVSQRVFLPNREVP